MIEKDRKKPNTIGHELFIFPYIIQAVLNSGLSCFSIIPTYSVCVLTEQNEINAYEQFALINIG